MASRELDSVLGYHSIKSTEAREIMQPYLREDGYYLLRPSGDSKGGVLCTICVTNRSKLVNYRLVKDTKSGTFYIYSHTSFPSIHQLLAYYGDTPINREVNTRLLAPISAPQQLQQPQQIKSQLCVKSKAPPNKQIKPQKSVKRPLPQQPPQQQQQQPQQQQQDLRQARVNGSDDHYVTMQKKSDSVSSDGTPGDDRDIPGLHLYLPKTEINAVMEPYLQHSGYYLVRPSASMEGQLTLAVSQAGKVLNFKINCEGGDYFIAPKRRFNTVIGLLDSYSSVPIKSKKAANEKIFLLQPIPVDPVLEQRHKQLLEEKAARKASNNVKATSPPAAAVNEPLPHPWQEHYNEQYKKKYYYNTDTGASMWERPKPAKAATTTLAPALPPPRKTNSLKRPLPSVPGGSSSPTASQLNTRTLPPSRQREPLPVPAQQNGGPSFSFPESSSPGHIPPLPPKENNVTPTNVRDYPPLPPKEDSAPVKSHPPLPPKESGSNNPPLPPKDGGGMGGVRNNLTPSSPSLPPRVMGTQQRPSPSPSSSTVSPSNTRPPLPVPNCNPSMSLPPLPPKESSPGPPPGGLLPPLPPKSNEPAASPSNRKSKKKEKRIVEYEDTVIQDLPPRSKSYSVPASMPSGKPGAPSPPPLPGVAVSPPPPPPPPAAVGGNAPPPPPPPPAIVTPTPQAPAPPPLGGGGAPPPPPPPPMAPPPSPLPVRSTRAETFSSPGMTRGSSKPSPQAGAGSGRPFGAGDLQAAKGLLRQRSDIPSQEPREQGGMMSLLSTALDSRMKSIRQAVVDSDPDSEYDEADDDDEDWDD